MKIYLVGGAVRDELLGRKITERDWVVVGGSSQEMLALGFESVGKHFPVFLHPQTKEEYALARAERKVGMGYHGFEFDTSHHVTLEDDLKRRDLTINAMAKTDNNEIIDPYGGQADLKNKILRHVSDSFVEDPVRVLRVARFAARFAKQGFTIAPQTLTLMQTIVNNNECDFLVPERIWKEMERALAEETSVAFIQALKQCGALERILPEIDKLYGVPQSVKWHPEVDTGIHMELVLERATQLSQDPKIRFAALVHDLGKALTPSSAWPEHKGHEIAGQAPLKTLCQRLKVPLEYQSLANIVMRYHGEYHSLKERTPEEILQLLEKIDAFRRQERYVEFMVACLADFQGRPGYENKEHPSEKILKKAFNAASSVDVKAVIATLNNKNGEAIKQAIHQARNEAIQFSLSQT